RNCFPWFSPFDCDNYTVAIPCVGDNIYIFSFIKIGDVSSCLFFFKRKFRIRVQMPADLNHFLFSFFETLHQLIVHQTPAPLSILSSYLVFTYVPSYKQTEIYLLTSEKPI